jgi:hypothetical protein
LNYPSGVLVAALLALTAAQVRAAEPSAEVDLELLEFLGSLDTEDEEWREYLAERPIRSEMGKPAAKAASNPEPAKVTDGKARPTEDKVKKP